MIKKLWVSGIPYATTEDQLKEAFSECGTVDSVYLPIDKMTGRPRGFGFVEMSTVEEAQAAIERWNGKDMGGRTIVVKEANPPTERTNSGGGYRSGGDRGDRGDRGGYGQNRSMGGNSGGNRSW